MNTENTTAQWVIILAFAAIYIIWGTTYLAILIGLEDFPPFLMASFRFIIAAFFLLGWSFYKGERKITFSALKKNFIVGIIVLAGGQGLLIWSEQHIASGYAAVLGATLPVWFVLIDVDHCILRTLSIPYPFHTNIKNILRIFTPAKFILTVVFIRIYLHYLIYF